MSITPLLKQRLALGIAQGLLLFLLYFLVGTESWLGNNSFFVAPLLLLVLLLPPLMSVSLGHLSRRALMVWAAVIVLVAAVLGAHYAWRADSVLGRRDFWSSEGFFTLVFFSSLGFFIAQSLVLAAAADHKRIASYSRYFETAWKLAIQISFSFLFVILLWLVLFLGVGLFSLIKLGFLVEVLIQPFIFMPIIATAFAAGLHITDVQQDIVRSVRKLLMGLLSWLLPLTVALTGIFLLSLPFTGLQPLWETRHATPILLTTATLLIIFINAIFQDGVSVQQTQGLLYGSARLASFLLLPLALIALYSLGLRIASYGWTHDRVLAAAYVALTLSYALGYAWAALKRAHWAPGVAWTNISGAFLVLAVLFALLSPLADPVRIGVNSQVARLHSGAVTIEKFDFDYLKFDGQRYGMAALNELKNFSGPNAAAIQKAAMHALAKKNRWSEPERPVLSSGEIAKNLRVWPKNSPALPTSFLEKNWFKNEGLRSWVPQCLKSAGAVCDAYWMDLNQDGRQDLLLVSINNVFRPLVILQTAPDEWEISARLEESWAACPQLVAALQSGDYQLQAPLLKDLVVGGQRFSFIALTRQTVQCQ